MRDLSVFKIPVPETTATKTSRRWRDSCAELAKQLGLPPIIARHAVNKGASKTRVHQIAQQFFAGCHLSGQAFTDKHLTRTAKNADPRSAVVRPDGTMVSYAVWVLSQEGSIPDSLLLQAAHALVRHDAAKKAPKPAALTKPAAQTGPPQINQEISQEITNDITSLIDLGPERGDDGEPYDPLGSGPAEFSGPSALAWDDRTQTMVRVAAGFV